MSDSQVIGVPVDEATFAGVFEDCGLRAFFQAPMGGVLLDFDDADDGPLIIEGSRSDEVANCSMMQDEDRRPDGDKMQNVRCR